MTQPELTEEFMVLVKKMEETLIRKGNDYSNADRLSNFKQVAAIMGGHPAKVAMGLMVVKISRINNLVDSGKGIENESLEDSALDLCVYSLLNYFCLKDKA